MYPAHTQPIPSSWQNGLPPALATSEQRGVLGCPDVLHQNLPGCLLAVELAVAVSTSSRSQHQGGWLGCQGGGLQESNQDIRYYKMILYLCYRNSRLHSVFGY